MNHNHSHTNHVMTIDNRAGFRKFLPLIMIFLVILGWTAVFEWYAGKFNFARAMQEFMAGFFLIFGGLKMWNWKEFAEIYSGYDLIAARVKAYGYIYPLIEVGLGLAYLFSYHIFYANILTILIMGIGAIGVAKKLAQKEEIPCACLGGVFQVPLTTVTLIEDLLMAAMASGMLFI
jgi:hypothetical protein